MELQLESPVAIMQEKLVQLCASNERLQQRLDHVESKNEILTKDLDIMKSRRIDVSLMETEWQTRGMKLREVQSINSDLIREKKVLQNQLERRTKQFEVMVEERNAEMRRQASVISDLIREKQFLQNQLETQTQRFQVKLKEKNDEIVQLKQKVEIFTNFVSNNLHHPHREDEHIRRKYNQLKGATEKLNEMLNSRAGENVYLKCKIRSLEEDNVIKTEITKKAIERMCMSTHSNQIAQSKVRPSDRRKEGASESAGDSNRAMNFRRSDNSIRILDATVKLPPVEVSTHTSAESDYLPNKKRRLNNERDVSSATNVERVSQRNTDAKESAGAGDEEPLMEIDNSRDHAKASSSNTAHSTVDLSSFKAGPSGIQHLKKTNGQRPAAESTPTKGSSPDFLHHHMGNVSTDPMEQCNIDPASNASGKDRENDGDDEKQTATKQADKLTDVGDDDDDVVFVGEGHLTSTKTSKGEKTIIRERLNELNDAVIEENEAPTQPDNEPTAENQDDTNSENSDESESTTQPDNEPKRPTYFIRPVHYAKRKNNTSCILNV